ncbi:uroporphyrinogen-III C-methyltransferase [Roseobacter denitrificans]|nr:uroporphyrinogen-III C-methyltransferase [Roseobacter denitrificans]AVL54252.1 uroporphyrinogen-III C-methyltransferase [Roseobacter denitrificans]SFF97813.1 uroporphyrin-III C-methyltransferase [Roseobacter denitrificans OCh 114]
MLKKMNQGQVFLVGAGPGDPELLTLRALRMIQSADVVVHDRLVSRDIMALVPAGVRRINVGKKPNHHPVPQDEINALLVQLVQEGATVARLKGGDPMIFGRGSEEAAVLHAAGIKVSYAPGITAAQGVSASTGVPLTHRGLATGVRYVTGHCQANRPLDLDWDGLADADTTLVVYMGHANMQQIAAGLIERGLPAEHPVLVVANGTRPNETRLVTQLGALQIKRANIPVPGPVLFIVGRVVTLIDSEDSTAADTLLRAPELQRVLHG